MKLSTILLFAAIGVAGYFAFRKTKSDELREILIKDNVMKKELTEAEKKQLIDLLCSISNEAELKELSKALEEITQSDDVDIFALIEDLLTEEEQLKVLQNWKEKGFINVETFKLDDDDKAAIEKIIEEGKEGKDVENLVKEAAEEAEEKEIEA